LQHNRLDKLLNVVGIPLLQASFGGNAENQRNAIAISDLQVKVAELQRGRAELAQKIREQVYRRCRKDNDLSSKGYCFKS
jgi:hypothetical protein